MEIWYFENILAVAGDKYLHLIEIKTWTKCHYISDNCEDQIITLSEDIKHLSTFGPVITVCDNNGDIVGYKCTKIQNRGLHLKQIFSIKLEGPGIETKRYI